jgi:hypothetical protein
MINCERHTAEPGQNRRTPDRDRDQYATHSEQDQAGCERGRCRCAKSDRFDQTKQVERGPEAHLASDGMQREILRAVVRQRETCAEPDDHCGGDTQTKAAVTDHEAAEA